MKLPSKLAGQRDKLAQERADDSISPHTSYADTQIGFNAACEILLPELEKMKEDLATFIKLNNSIKENPHNVGEEYELAIEGLEESLQSYREVIGDD